MDETPFSSYSDELSAEDLAIIRMFDETNDLAVAGSLESSPKSTAENWQTQDQAQASAESPDDMLMLFASEAEEDIGTMRRTLVDLEQDNQPNSPSLVTLGRAAHKLKGTSGAMGCERMSTIAWHIEEEIQLLKDEKITVLTALSALVHAITALEMTLQSVVDDGQESPVPLQELMQQLNALHTADDQATVITNKQKAIKREDLEPPAPAPAPLPFDMRHLHALISHTEHLIELNTPLQGIQKKIAQSLMELHAAHGRLHYLEGVLSTLTLPGMASQEQGHEPTGSSLVARILQRTNRPPAPRRPPSSPLLSPPGAPAEPALWDEMEMDRFTEHKILLQSFSEAVADVATATSQLKTAYAQMEVYLEQQTHQVMVVRNDALRLRSAPFSVLLTRVQQIVQTLEQRHKRTISLETAGETTEIDQDILEFLAEPLLNLIRTNVADSLLSVPLSPLQEPDRIWLQAQAQGNEIVIDLGFSMPIPGGALEALRGPMQQIHGTSAARRNPSGGVIYQLRFPRAQGLIQGLLVHAGGQGLVLPLPHIEGIDYKRQEAQAQIYHLGTLLSFPPVAVTSTLPPPILMAGSQRRVAIQVDEIIGEIELIMRPLEPHLQRPGIVGTAVDGSGNVLLIVDLPALVRFTINRQPLPALNPNVQAAAQVPDLRQPARLLVADDSVYIRQSLRQTFERAGYAVVEARDGIEALECLSSDQPPAVMLLDIEMPNLNGYDLLNILHSQPGFVDCKTILLTSRSSDKHRQRAMELGAYAFLGKPCPQDMLLDTVYKALANMPAPI